MYLSWITKKNGCLKMKWEAMQMKSNLMKNKSPLMHNNLSPNADEPPLTFRSPSPPNKKTDPIEGRFPTHSKYSRISATGFRGFAFGISSKWPNCSMLMMRSPGLTPKA